MVDDNQCYNIDLRGGEKNLPSFVAKIGN